MNYRIAFPLRRDLLIITAILGSVGLAGCSDVTAPTPVPGAPQSDRAISVAGINSRASAVSAEGSRPCAAPGTGLPGALNMLHDRTMFTVAMAHANPRGNEGMFHAVGVSGC